MTPAAQPPPGEVAPPLHATTHARIADERPQPTRKRYPSRSGLRLPSNATIDPNVATPVRCVPSTANGWAHPTRTVRMRTFSIMPLTAANRTFTPKSCACTTPVPPGDKLSGPLRLCVSIVSVRTRGCPAPAVGNQRPLRSDSNGRPPQGRLVETTTTPLRTPAR